MVPCAQVCLFLGILVPVGRVTSCSLTSVLGQGLLKSPLLKSAEVSHVWVSVLDLTQVEDV